MLGFSGEKTRIGNAAKATGGSIILPKLINTVFMQSDKWSCCQHFIIADGQTNSACPSAILLGRERRFAPCAFFLLYGIFREDGIVVLDLQLLETFEQLLSHLLHAGLPVKIVQFVGIGLQVVEFPNVYVVVEVHEFVTLGADAVVALHGVFGGIFVMMVIDVVASLLGVLAV